MSIKSGAKCAWKPLRAESGSRRAAAAHRKRSAQTGRPSARRSSRCATAADRAPRTPLQKSSHIRKQPEKEIYGPAAPAPLARGGAGSGGSPGRGGAGGTETVRADGAAPRGGERRGRGREGPGPPRGFAPGAASPLTFFRGCHFIIFVEQGQGASRSRSGAGDERSGAAAPAHAARPRRQARGRAAARAARAIGAGPAPPAPLTPAAPQSPGASRGRPALRRVWGESPARPGAAHSSAAHTEAAPRAPPPSPAPGPAGTQRAAPEPRGRRAAAAHRGGAESCWGGPARLPRRAPPLIPSRKLQI